MQNRDQQLMGSQQNGNRHPSADSRSIRLAAGTRRYRSKTQRPCDLCRSRKVLCNIPDPSRPCQLCDRTSRACTFQATPAKKRNHRKSSYARRSPMSPLSDGNSNLLGQETLSSREVNLIPPNQQVQVTMDIDNPSWLIPSGTISQIIWGRSVLTLYCRTDLCCTKQPPNL